MAGAKKAAKSKKSGPAGAKSLGVLGLGIIGSRVAEACRKAGLDVRVWNRTPRKGPGFCTSPAEVAKRARVIQIFVADDSAVAAVMKSLGPQLERDHVVINSSTISLDATLALDAQVTAAGARFLDCPFTGSRNAAAAGELNYYVGGPAALLEEVRWALEPSAKAILHVGKVGDATVLKLATNMISATTVEILSEAMGVVAAHGVPLEAFAQAMELNACASGLTRMKIPSILGRDFDPHFSLKNMLKDARFASMLAERSGLETPALNVVAARMAALVGRGRGDSDYSILATNYV
jgi:3-hydroxyisobutyrate dehydrogenase-like beta-hydroxyacid dehydrogenase